MELKKISISECLISLEGVLNIEYSDDLTTEQLIRQSIKSLEQRYGVSLDKSVYEIQNESQLSTNNLNRFISSVSTSLQHLALYTCMCYYTKNLPFDLSEVNYLRYAQEELKTYLGYLLDEDTYVSEHTNIMSAFTVALDNITPTYIKRLFIIMLILDRLGMYDGASVVAMILYMGTI